MHAWFSNKQSELTGVILYQSPTGGVVECTSVTDTPEASSVWEDLEYRGEVVRYLRRMSEPTIKCNRYY